MMHTADMMRAFARYRGDAILVPGATEILRRFASTHPAEPAPTMT